MCRNEAGVSKEADGTLPNSSVQPKILAEGARQVDRTHLDSETNIDCIDWQGEQDSNGYPTCKKRQSPADRVRHLHPTWMADPRSLAPDGLSSFYPEDGGIMCRICSPFRDKIKSSSKKEFISKLANPTHSGTLFDHVKTDVHLEALALWIAKTEQINVAFLTSIRSISNRTLPTKYMR
ncbi:hypothetical protein BLNAU_16428 [Blattamonas nauphoetae]|uniref:Uncharacterized protein n=1 Tax=Blattamonas nauphoetae TaxID=2049346 RepID=A0ABQ9XCM5_9EUKA|nr:hypothetical protein BLNAU_16428 [Blattamonas nauphoetae]